jgi:CBS domain containing-hemolysin-like protein
MLIQFFILLFLLLLCAFFEAGELAFVFANKIKVELRSRKKKLSAVYASYFMKKPELFYSTILLANNIANIAFTSMITLVLSLYFGMSEWSILAVSTFLILFIGQLLPKMIATEIPNIALAVTIIPVRMISIVFYPLVRSISFLSDFLTKKQDLNEDKFNYLFDKKEIKSLINESLEAGVVTRKEGDIITRIIELGEQRVSEAMRPRTEIAGIDIESSLELSISRFVESGFSKMPVYEDTADNIKGIVFAKDIYKSPESLRSIIRPVVFVPDSKKSIDMLNEFLHRHLSFAVVVDEFGGTAGIITMEDIIEELFGEIKDEFDVDEEVCRKTGENSYIVSGAVEIDYVNEHLGILLPEGDYKTIGGFITSRIGRIPAKNEIIKIDDFEVVILRSSLTRIELVRMTLTDE